MKYTSIFAFTLLAAVPTLANPTFVSFVSERSGNDLNPSCTISTPCQTFQGAYAKTIAGGIIKAMDAGEYGPIVITQPITIDGNGVGATIDVSGNNSQGVNVNTPAAGAVEIRNLTINVEASCSACYGIQTQNGSVSVENVSITGAPTYGVYVNGGTATIHGVTVTGATSYGILVRDGTATISDSIIRYSTYGIFVDGNSVVTQALIERSKMISNATGLGVFNTGAAATARISDCVITANTTGVLTSGAVQIITFRNNTWAGNTTDGTTPFSVSLK